MVFTRVDTRESGAYPSDTRSSGVGWKCGLGKHLPGVGLSVGPVGYAPAPARIHADLSFHGLFVIAFARIHAERCPGVSARIPVASVAYSDTRRYDEAVDTRGFAGY